MASAQTMAEQQHQMVYGQPTKFFELEQSVQQLRPLVLQVLRSQMNHNSTAAVDLRRGIRKVREICKQLRAETVFLSKQKKVTEQVVAGGWTNGAGVSYEQPQQPGQQQQSTPKRQKVEAQQHSGAAGVVGGSPYGMNFVIVQPADDQKVPVG